MAIAQGFGARLAEVVSERRWTQLDLAERVHASPSFVSAVLRGLKAPGAEFLVSLQQALGVSVDWLLTGKGGKYATPVDGAALQDLSLQIEIIRAAARTKQPEAVALVRRFLPEAALPNLREPLPDEDQLGSFVGRLAISHEANATAVAIYNRVFVNVAPESRTLAVAEELLAYLNSKREPALRPRGEEADNIIWNPEPLAPGRMVGDALGVPKGKRRRSKRAK